MNFNRRDFIKITGTGAIAAGMPDVALLPYVEKKVKEYDLRLGIHNHGPDQKLYPGPDDTWEAIKSLDKRIGFCLDIGHTTRLGLDPLAGIAESIGYFRGVLAGLG